MIARLAAPALSFVVFAVPTGGLYVWTEVNATPPVTLTIGASPAKARSRPFQINQTGLYLIVEQKVGPGCVGTGCVRPQDRLSWSVTRRGSLIARDTLGPEGAVDLGLVRMVGDRRERELGSVRLSRASDYVLEVQRVGDLSALPPSELRDVHVRLHPWDVKAGLGSIAALGVGLLASASSLLWLLGRAISLTWLGRRAAKGV